MCLEATGHLGAAADVVGFGALLVPAGPWEFNATEGNAQIVEAVVDDLWVVLYVLYAEVSAEAGEDAAGLVGVDGDVDGRPLTPLFPPERGEEECFASKIL